MKNKRTNVKELVKVLNETAGTPLTIATDFMWSAIQFCATVYFLSEKNKPVSGIDKNLVPNEGEFFGKDFSLAFYNNEIQFGIPFDSIHRVNKVHIKEKNLTVYEIFVITGETYRISIGAK